jgi:D-methionine transport system ATP-binding protein
MKVIDLKDYVIGPQTEGRTFEPFDFSLSRGDVCLLSTDSTGDALAFLKALATLTRPLQGRYRFNGDLLNLWDHDSLLSVKKKIGYITSHTALISNRTIQDNLLWIGAYYNNTLSVEPDQRTRELCDLFSIHKIMDRRPSELSARDCHLVITIRELAKSPEVLLLENPEDLIGLANFGIFWDVFAKLTEEQLPVVFLSNSKSFIQSFSNRKLMIMQGKLTETQTPE